MKKETQLDVLHNDFTILLKAFNSLTDTLPPIKSIEGKLGEIKQKATNLSGLTGRQREAITARCDNYLAGQYGKQVERTDEQFQDLKQIQSARQGKTKAVTT